ncbi:MAG: glycosyltransferase family 4 protein [Methanoregulaceae archaeon]|nr:glycosyltransferase family 4 protein [Methanoregulaceae archaeon]
MPRVTFVLSLHGGLVGGGLENQAEATKAALEERGWDIEVHQPLNRSLGDLVHFFGTFDSFWDVARQCQARGVPYVCSPVFLPPVQGSALRLRALRKRITDRTSFRGQRKLYEQAAKLFTLSAQEQRNLQTYFGGHLAPFVSIPNGVSEQFVSATPDAFRAAHPFARPVVICTGRLADRKNQLTLIRAVAGLEVDLVLYGPMDDEGYVAQCRAEAGLNVHFLGSLPPGDPMLASAYAAAEVFCQPSRMEVLSLSALEAACGGARLVLSDAWGAEEFFGGDAVYCPSDDVARWRDAIQAALNTSQNREDQRNRYANTYTWPSVAAQIEAQYRQVLASR